ncbi:efflux transporter outer membrane subunit [Legionella maioricensis]|uniref:Efflux transporter outer membrane subunit n=1 Tax=Legionella maioricensis TaxID=2896528 RepID=A0A9X2CXT0_9GAMM|nr:efflux transporter outer membrane subunit [Legionella maioricensis]MCL9682488.1 efflux transporter outer membrane subunit [Legionella maioricensis]MCL9686265.1 efflux transporter outer membrane subunit [Legionella maioricensis]
MRLTSSTPCANKYNLFIICFLLAGIAILSGCANYIGIRSHKKIAHPAQFQTQKSIPKQNGHWPTTNWAKQFGDPQLVFLINEALANNPSLQVAQARIVQAQALADSRAAAFFPTINLSSQVARTRISANVLPPDLGGGRWFTFGEFLVRANYEIDIWGKNLANYRQAIAQEKVSETEAQQSRLIISTTVASSYNQLAYYYALREVLRSTVAQREALEKISAVRLRTGLDTRVQLYQSRNTTANARTQLLDVEGQILLTRQQLGTLLGGGPDRGLQIKRPRLKSINTPELPPNLPLSLLGRRPDIVGARWNVEATCQGVKYTKAKFYPNVNLAALAGFLSLRIDRLFENPSTAYQFGPALSLPIFDGNNLRSQLRGQYGYYEEAVANYNNTLNNALSDVAAQLTSIHSTDNQIRTQKEALYTSEHAYNLARFQYRTGLASQLVVLDAETLFLNAQQTRLQLIANRRNQQIALIKALGGGFDACCHAPGKKMHEDK